MRLSYPQRLIEVGDRVQCINPESKFYQMVGICDELNYEKYGQFCMCVQTVGERVDPCNWMIINHVCEQVPKTMIFK